MRELPAYEAPVDPGARRLGIVAVAVLAAVVAGIVILMCFSTLNTPMSNDGNHTTKSQWIEDGSGS